MELWIARQRRGRDKTCGRFNAAIYGAVAIALREDRKCPRELIREGGRTMLVLEDPGGEPLERLLGVPFEMDLFLRSARTPDLILAIVEVGDDWRCYRTATDAVRAQLLAFSLFDGSSRSVDPRGRLFLVLRPSKLPRSSTEHLTEMTR